MNMEDRRREYLSAIFVPEKINFVLSLGVRLTTRRGVVLLDVDDMENLLHGEDRDLPQATEPSRSASATRLIDTSDDETTLIDVESDMSGSRSDVNTLYATSSAYDSSYDSDDELEESDADDDDEDDEEEDQDEAEQTDSDTENDEGEEIQEQREEAQVTKRPENEVTAAEKNRRRIALAWPWAPIGWHPKWLTVSMHNDLYRFLWRHPHLVLMIIIIYCVCSEIAGIFKHNFRKSRRRQRSRYDPGCNPDPAVGHPWRRPRLQRHISAPPSPCLACLEEWQAREWERMEMFG